MGAAGEEEGRPSQGGRAPVAGMPRGTAKTRSRASGSAVAPLSVVTDVVIVRPSEIPVVLSAPTRNPRPHAAGINFEHRFTNGAGSGRDTA